MRGGDLRLRKCYAFRTVQRGRLRGHPLPARLIYLLPPCGDERVFFFFFTIQPFFFPSLFYIQQKVSLVWAIDEPFLGSNAPHL